MRGIQRWFKRESSGFTYIIVMVAITVMGIVMTMAARQWQTMLQRELELDLLSKGIEIQTALALYSASKKAGRVVPGEYYPNSLAELTRPPRPFLRKIYQDPIGHGEWQLVRAPTGGIMGVRSASQSRPIKQSDFPMAVRHFQGKSKHQEWVFQHPSPSMAGGMLAPGMSLFPRMVPPMQPDPSSVRRDSASSIPPMPAEPIGTSGGGGIPPDSGPPMNMPMPSESPTGMPLPSDPRP